MNVYAHFFLTRALLNFYVFLKNCKSQVNAPQKIGCIFLPFY
jgi:hypothetical protein